MRAYMERLGMAPLPPAKRDRTPSTDRGTIYFAAGGHGLIKIGFTLGPIEYRIRNISFASGVVVTLLGTTRGTRMDERAHHDRFASTRAIGEWFADSPELRAYIAKVTK